MELAVDQVTGPYSSNNISSQIDNLNIFINILKYEIRMW